MNRNFYDANSNQLNTLSTAEMLRLQQNLPTNLAPTNAQGSHELQDLEQFVLPGVVQKHHLEGLIARVDCRGNLFAALASTASAFEPVLETKARVAFDLLKLSTVMKDRLERLVLSEVDSGLLREQLINELDQAWTTNTNLIQGVVVAARRISSRSDLAQRIESALFESGMHQAMVSV